jgi:hypothetical protein
MRALTLLGRALREKKFSRCEFNFFKGVRSMRNWRLSPNGVVGGQALARTETRFLMIGSKCGIVGNVPDGQFRENGLSGELF